MKKIEINWNWVIWICAILLFLWLIAKQLGYINTPLILELFPYITGFGLLAGIIRNFGKYLQKLENVTLDIKEMKIDIKDIKEDVHKLDKRVSIVEHRVGIIESEISFIKSKI